MCVSGVALSRRPQSTGLCHLTTQLGPVVSFAFSMGTIPSGSTAVEVLNAEAQKRGIIDLPDGGEKRSHILNEVGVHVPQQA